MSTNNSMAKPEVDQIGQVEEHEHHVAVHTDTFDIADEALGIDLPKNYWRSPAFLGTVLALALGYTCNNLGWTLSANSLALINEDIGPSDNITWVALANTLGLSVAFLLVGRMSDIFGRRWFFIIGNLFALVGCIISGTASTVNAIIGGNVLNGLAGAVQISFTAAIAELVPNKHRPLWVGGLLFSSFPVMAFGPVIAEKLGTGTAASWRWCFYLGIIVSGITIALLYFCYHPPNFSLLHQNRSRMQQVKRMDFIGMVLFTGGLILFLMGLSWGGSQYPWKSAHVIATIVVGFLSLAAFAVYDGYHKGDSLMPLHLFKNRGYAAMIITATVASCVYYSMGVLWPQQIASLFPGSSLHRGFLACTLGGSVVLGQLIGGLICHYVKQHRYILMSSAICLTVFSGAMASLNPGTQARGVALLFMAGFSLGVVETASLALAPLSCRPEDIGVALGTLGSIRSAGGAVATAIYTSILTNKLTSLTPPKVTKAALDAGLPRSSLPELLADYSTNITAVPGINQTIITAVNDAVAQASADSFRYVWYAVIAFGCVSIIAACLTINYETYMTDDIARKLQTTRPDGPEKEDAALKSV